MTGSGLNPESGDCQVEIPGLRQQAHPGMTAAISSWPGMTMN